MELSLLTHTFENNSGPNKASVPNVDVTVLHVLCFKVLYSITMQPSYGTFRVSDDAVKNRIAIVRGIQGYITIYRWWKYQV